MNSNDTTLVPNDERAQQLLAAHDSSDLRPHLQQLYVERTGRWINRWRWQVWTLTGIKHTPNPAPASEGFAPTRRGAIRLAGRDAGERIAQIALASDHDGRHPTGVALQIAPTNATDGRTSEGPASERPGTGGTP